MLRREDIDGLAGQISGRVFLPGEEGYAAECAIFNLNLVLEPALVVAVTSPADVQAAVRFAAEGRMPIAVKASGHQPMGPAHGALLICTRRMNAVTIDAGRRTARIEAGALWGQVIEEAAKLGLAPMSGSSPRVGAVGYTLGGGQSVALSRSQGYAADHVLSLDVVTADGQLRHATGESEPDLFWATRGGKDNFGVVTAMVCELFPQATFYGGGVWFSLEHMRKVIPAWRDWVETLPEEATSSFAVQRLPPLPELPESLRGAAVLHMRFVHLGPAAEGERLFAPMRGLAPARHEAVAEMPYASIALVHLDPVDPIPYWDRSLMLRGLPDQAIEALLALTGPQSGSPLFGVEVRRLGGAMDREPAAPNAVSTRGIPYMLFGYGVGGPDRRDLLRGALDRLIRGMQPWAAERQFINILSPEQGTSPEELRSVYGAEIYDRLARVKKAYDPLNLFRMNHNIKPAEG
jgi:hypothetical protein